MKKIFYEFETSSATAQPIAIQYRFAAERTFKSGITRQIIRNEKLKESKLNIFAGLCFCVLHFYSSDTFTNAKQSFRTNLQFILVAELLFLFHF